ASLKRPTAHISLGETTPNPYSSLLPEPKLGLGTILQALPQSALLNDEVDVFAAPPDVVLSAAFKTPIEHSANATEKVRAFFICVSSEGLRQRHSDLSSGCPDVAITDKAVAAAVIPNVASRHGSRR